MNVVKQSAKLLSMTHDAAQLIELAARLCYKSEPQGGPAERVEFIKKLIKAGHHSVLEHASASFHIVTDRGISHELVRHRLASYSQESTRYCKYDDITVVAPDLSKDDSYDDWFTACNNAEYAYKKLIEADIKPQHARAVLPTCLKTELVMTANFREWRHIISLRWQGKCGTPHPQIRWLLGAILAELMDTSAACCFEDLQ